MQELFLFGQIDDARHAQVLSILAGLTASKPRTESERHVLFKPIKAVSSQNGMTGGGTQTIATKPAVLAGTGNKESFHVRLVKSVQLKDFGQAVSASEASSGWIQRFYDTPDPVQRSAGLRTVRDVGMRSENPLMAMKGAGYT